MKININDIVKIKINEKGIDILKKEHEELKKYFPKLGDFNLQKVDEYGYTEMQLHDVMRIFGEYLTLGFDLPIETEIIVNDK